MNSQLIFNFIIGFILIEFLTERILAYLNSTCWSSEIPGKLNGIYKVEKYRKSQDYEKINHSFATLTSMFSLILILGMLWFEGFAFVDSWARSYSANPIVLSLLFFGILGFASDILSLPFSIYHTFVIEERFGFNKTSLKTFVFDKLKSWLLIAIIGGGLLSLVIWIYSIAGSYFWVLAWAVLSLFMICITILYSTIIVPLFNKQTPLEDGELRDAIEAFAKKAGFQLTKIFVIDGSKRSSKANAYFSGFGPQKRIVLFDTLIIEHTIEELVAVLAHEIGHYKKKHTLFRMLTSIIQSGFMLFILSLFIDNPLLSNALGSETQSFHLGILTFGILYSPISMLFSLISNWISRRNEYSADKFAAIHYDANSLILALKKLSVNNLSNLSPHPAYVFFYYSHPPLLQRIEALDTLINDIVIDRNFEK